MICVCCRSVDVFTYGIAPGQMIRRYSHMYVSFDMYRQLSPSARATPLARTGKTVSRYRMTVPKDIRMVNTVLRKCPSVLAPQLSCHVAPKFFDLTRNQLQGCCDQPCQFEMLFLAVVLSAEPLFSHFPPVRLCMSTIVMILNAVSQGLDGIFRGFVSSSGPVIRCARPNVARSLSWFAFSPLIPGAIKQDLNLTPDQVRKYLLVMLYERTIHLFP